MAKKRKASSLHQRRFPWEKPAYRSARDKLLKAERKLRRDIESVAAMRRKLPAPHVTQRANLAVVAKSPIERIKEFANGRGWNNLRLLSSAGNTYNHDYHGETENGSQIPTMNVFTRRRGRIYHTWSSELLFLQPDKGQDGRHVDLI